MESALSISSKPSFHNNPNKTQFFNSHFFNPNLHYPISKPYKNPTIKISATVNTTTTTATAVAGKNPVLKTLQLAARAVVFAAATGAAFSKFQNYPAIAEPITQTETLEKPEPETEPEISILPEFLESNSEAVSSMKTLLEEKLEAGEDEESLKILKKLVLAQPENVDWKFLMARLLNEMGEVEPAREALEEILSQNPLSFEALFENALLMDSCGEGELVIKRLEKALEIAESESKEKEARDIRLIIAQVQFLQKNVDEALKSYDELLNEDPNDFRPYFCKGMIYSLIDKNDEAKVQFAKYRELSPKKFEVEGYLRTPLSRMKLFGTDEEN